METIQLFCFAVAHYSTASQFPNRLIWITSMLKSHIVLFWILFLINDTASFRRSRLFQTKKIWRAGFSKSNSILLSSFPSYSNSTITEYSVWFEEMKTKTLKNEAINSILKERQKLVPEVFVTFDQGQREDKGTSDSYNVMSEFLNSCDDWENNLNIFRRNIALRANRVLHPARNAQQFAFLINSMISDNQWTFSRAVADYVGLTPTTYCNINSSNDEFCQIDLLKITDYICRRMLELDIDRMAWLRSGREGLEPSTPQSRGESMQEWLYTQVHRSDLGFRVCDMIQAVLRLSLRHAIEKRHEANKFTSSTGNISQLISIKMCSDKKFIRAGIPIDSMFVDRCEQIIRTDITLLPYSFGSEYVQRDYDDIKILSGDTDNFT